MQALEACFVKRARLHQLHGAFERAMGRVHATGEQERLIDTRLTLIARDPVGQHSLIFDDAGGEVGHHGIAVFGQTLGGCHHVFDGRAFDVRNVDACAFRQERPEVFHLFGGAGHDLDGVTLQERLHFGAVAGRLRFTLFEVQKCHDTLP